MLAVLVDQHAGDKGIWTPFFNRLASTTPLPAILAAKTRAELLPVAIFTVGPAQWRLEAGEFIPKRGASIEELTLSNQSRARVFDYPTAKRLVLGSPKMENSISKISAPRIQTGRLCPEEL